MINNKRISKLKKEIFKIKGNPKYLKCIVKAREGLYLFGLKKDIKHHKECYKPIDKEIEGLEVIECSDYSIEDILIVGDGKSELVVFTDDILEDIPNDVKERFKKACFNNPDNPYKELTTEDLKVLIDE
ncbi:MAG: hypothetical protein KH415_19950 [Clostridium sp.]|nr:hypothetical protein [Clostridium sp.]